MSASSMLAASTDMSDTCSEGEGAGPRFDEELVVTKDPDPGRRFRR